MQWHGKQYSIYTDGVLQRMLTKDLEEYQLSTDIPGRYLVEANIYSYYEAEPGQSISYGEEQGYRADGQRDRFACAFSQKI